MADRRHLVFAAVPALIAVLVLIAWLMQADAPRRVWSNNAHEVPVGDALGDKPPVVPNGRTASLNDAPQPAPAEAPKRRPLPVWKPMPLAPVAAVRELTDADLGFLDAAQIARIQAGISSKRYSATIKGSVKAGDGGPARFVRVWAESVEPQTEYLDLPDSRRLQLDRAEVCRIWPVSAPAGTALTDENGNYELVVSLTGANQAQLLAAALSGVAGEPDDRFVGRLFVHAGGPDTLCQPVRLSPVRPEDVRTDALIQLWEGPFAEFLLTYDNGFPCSNVPAVIWFHAGKEALEKEVAQQFSACTGVDGRVKAPLRDGTRVSVLVLSGLAAGAQSSLESPDFSRQLNRITVERSSRTAIWVIVQVAGENGAKRSDSVRIVCDGKFGSIYRIGTSDRACFSPKATPQRVQFASPDAGAIAVEVPQLSAGWCAEFLPVVLPGERTARLHVVDAGGLALADISVAEIEAVHWDNLNKSNTPSGTPATDSFGDVDVPILPGRTYQFSLKHPQLGRMKSEPMVIAGPGPHEIRWKND